MEMVEKTVRVGLQMLGPCGSISKEEKETVPHTCMLDRGKLETNNVNICAKRHPSKETIVDSMQ